MQVLDEYGITDTSTVASKAKRSLYSVVRQTNSIVKLPICKGQVFLTVIIKSILYRKEKRVTLRVHKRLSEFFSCT